MPGTVAGGKKTQQTLIAKLGSEDAVREWRRIIGSKGGSKSRGGGFAANPALARIAGAKGGATSRRTPRLCDTPEEQAAYDTGYFRSIAETEGKRVRYKWKTEKERLAYRRGQNAGCRHRNRDKLRAERTV